MSVEIETASEGDTIAAGRDFGRRLDRGTVVLLNGPLGAGKTAFARGIAEGLGCETTMVSSPTFTIVQEYRGRTTVQHVDLYRLTPKEVDDLGLEELGEDSVLVVEWPDRWHARPTDAIEIRLETIAENHRRITIGARR